MAELSKGGLECANYIPPEPEPQKQAVLSRLAATHLLTHPTKGWHEGEPAQLNKGRLACASYISPRPWRKPEPPKQAFLSRLDYPQPPHQGNEKVGGTSKA